MKPTHPKFPKLPLFLSTLGLVMFIASLAGEDRAPALIPSLKTVAIPSPSGIDQYVRDQDALVLLGKALFWDLQLGSDGKVACATCHFHAGADHRIRNQFSIASGEFTANLTLSANDFPFHQLADPANNTSAVIRDSKLVAGSAGVPARSFDGVVPGLSADAGADTPDPVFHAAGNNTRQVTGRNSPSVINAVFNFRNFWDGRARNTFSGATPFGASDPAPHVLSNGPNGLALETLRMENASLASQAVGPVLNGVEMSYSPRTWQAVGKKMLALQPLAYQRIAADDSVLGPSANPAGPGFAGNTTYLDLVKVAFAPAYWNSAEVVTDAGMIFDPAAPTPQPDWYTQSEFNFAMFFGLAVQAYESTLVSDETPLDRFADGDLSALTPGQQLGLVLFTGRTGCTACHSGAEMTLATHSGIASNLPFRSGAETGFFHIGVRPPAEDIGLGNTDDFGVPLSATFPVNPNLPSSATGRFKTPGLRNIELTGPYMHDGSESTLEQAIEFYNRGGDFPPNSVNGPNIRPLSMTATERANMLAFLRGLTDPRVRFERAPFDHPELCVANGHSDAPDGNPAFPLSAADAWAGLPAVGSGGNTAPLQTFEELLNGVGSDGSRAHNLHDPCEIEALTARGFVNANAASYARTVVARDSIVTAVGSGFSVDSEAAATNPAPSSLAGRSVEIEDAAGEVHIAPLFYVSPGQINYVLPEAVAPGPATIRVMGGSNAFRVQALVAEVAPGLFSAGGIAAANVVTLRDGVQTSGPVVTRDPTGALVPLPIDLGPESQQTVLVLYGTGIRNHLNPVVAHIGGETIAVSYAGAQGFYAGEDQINVPLPRALAGAGVVDVVLEVDGQTTNSVSIQIQ